MKTLRKMCLAMVFVLCLHLGDGCYVSAQSAPRQEAPGYALPLDEAALQAADGTEVLGYAVPLDEAALQAADQENALRGVETPVYAADADHVPTEEEAYQSMIALKATYPEGMRWTNSDYYGWKGGIFSGGRGCAGFAFLLSDAAFGSLPARMIRGNLSIDAVHVGDILRINGDTHSVIILEKYSDYVVLAEGNYNSSIHWGRKYSAEAIKNADYLMTRYPIGTFGEVCKITFDVNGGPENWMETSEQICEKGSTIALSSERPVWPGYSFLGWSTSPSAGTATYQPGDAFTADRDVTFYAVWGECPLLAFETSGIHTIVPGEFYRFIPKVSGAYTFESAGDRDLTGEICQIDHGWMKVLFGDDNSGKDMNYRFTMDLTAGEVYYLYSWCNGMGGREPYQLEITVPDAPQSFSVSGKAQGVGSGDATLKLIAAKETTLSDGTKVPAGTAVAQTTVSGADASYALTGIPAGSYTLTASRAGHVTRSYAVTVGSADVTQNVKLCLKGDVDMNGTVDIGDHQRLFTHLQGTSVITDAYQLEIANVDGAGTVDIGDHQRLFTHLQGTNPLQ